MNIIQSLIPSKGITLDGISFYYCEGKLRMRKAGGPSKKTIQKKASCTSIRNNNREFGCASTLSSLFRNSFGTSLKHYADSTINSRLTGVFRKMIQAGEGEPGKRTFDPKNQIQLLKDIEFNTSIPFDSVCKSMIQIHLSKNNSEIILETSISIQDDLNAPKHATHAMLEFSVVYLPVLGFDERLNRYVFPNRKSISFKRSSCYMEKIKLTDAICVNVDLHNRLVCEYESHSVVCMYGITFYSKDDLLKGMNSMKTGCYLVV